MKEKIGNDLALVNWVYKVFLFSLVTWWEKMSFIPKLKVISVWHVQFLPFNRQLN